MVSKDSEEANEAVALCDSGNLSKLLYTIPLHSPALYTIVSIFTIVDTWQHVCKYGSDPSFTDGMYLYLQHYTEVNETH